MTKERKTDRKNRRSSPSILCGAKKKQGGGGSCRKPKGWGTDHPGYGSCKLHGGSTPSGIIAATKERIAKEMRVGTTYGDPIDVDPHEALLGEVRRSAGHVRWLGELIGRFESIDELKQFSGVSRGDEPGDVIFTWERPAVWVQMYQDERSHLAKVAKMAIDAGVAERAVAVAEEQGQIMAQGIQLLLDGLQLNESQWRIAPGLVRQAFTTVLELGEESVHEAAS